MTKENAEMDAIIEGALEQLSMIFKITSKIAPDIAEFCKSMRNELIAREFSREEAMQIITVQMRQMGNNTK